MPTPIPKGFTIMELVIAVSLAAILLCLAVPGMNRFIDNQKTITATHRLITDLNQARLTAIKRYRRVVACPSPDGTECVRDNRWESGWIVFLDPDENWQPDRAADILRVTRPETELTIDTGGRTRVRFHPDGSAAGTNLTFAVCGTPDAEHARAVVVSNTGRVRTEPLPDRLDCPETS